MKAIVTEQKTKRYLFRTTPRYPDPTFYPYGSNQSVETAKKENHYSYIVAWQMEEYVDKE